MSADYAANWPPRHEEYPRMLYRPGEEIVWDGRKLDTKVVADDDELADAISDGWSLGPDAPKAFSLLDQSVGVILEQLPKLSKDELNRLYNDEVDGKTRKTVLSGIEKAVAALDAPADAEPE